MKALRFIGINIGLAFVILATFVALCELWGCSGPAFEVDTGGTGGNVAAVKPPTGGQSTWPAMNPTGGAFFGTGGSGSLGGASTGGASGPPSSVDGGPSDAGCVWTVVQSGCFASDPGKAGLTCVSDSLCSPLLHCTLRECQ